MIPIRSLPCTRGSPDTASPMFTDPSITPLSPSYLYNGTRVEDKDKDRDMRETFQLTKYNISVTVCLH